MATNDLIATMFEEPEVAGLQRQRQLAQLLMQQGAQTPQNQMVNGLYVPVNPMERIGNLGSLLMGIKSSENLDAKQSELAAALRQKEMGALQQYLKLKRGTPGQEGTPDFVQAGPMPDGSNIPVQPGRKAIAAVPGDSEAANLYAASNPYSKVLREMGMKGLSKEPKWEKFEKNLGNGQIATGVIDVNSDNPMATFRQGGTTYDKNYYDLVDNGLIPGGYGMPQTGYQTPQQGSTAPKGTARAIGGFENSVSNLWPREGGYVAKDGSSNAPANFGINQKWNPDVDVSKLTQDQAKQIYKTRYWDAIGADRLSSAAQEVAFDAAVNQGPEYAKALIAKTQGDPMAMINERRNDYINLARKPGEEKNLTGWLNRLKGIEQNVAAQGQVPAQSQLPQYQYDPNLTPKQNREEAQKFSKENQNAVRNVKGSFDLIKSASDILSSNAPSSGLIQNAGTTVGEWFGGGGEASRADAQLKVLAGKLTAQVPRFEGPQSDKDTALYQAMAGDIGNANKPIATRLAALQTMIDLNKKYYPEGDWGSIDTGGAVVQKNFLGGTRGLGAQTMAPSQFSEGLSEVDKEAFNWARKNPNDPRAAQINKRLGIN